MATARMRARKRLIHGKAPKARDFTNKRARRKGSVDKVARRKNRNKSRIRARVEHVFAVVKRLWGGTKARYRGLAKNANRAFVSLVLANLCLSRGRFTAQVRPVGERRAQSPYKAPDVGAKRTGNMSFMKVRKVYVRFAALSRVYAACSA